MTQIAPPSLLTSSQASSIQAAAARPNTELRETFNRTVGGVFYGQLLKSLRSGVGKPAYIHGGQAEEMFQSQLDEQVVESIVSRSDIKLVDALFERFEQGLRAQPAAEFADNASVEAAAKPNAPQVGQTTPQAELAELVRAAQKSQDDAQGARGTTAIPTLFRK
jgi:peptidoglycan hydrolase FlgJ